MTCPEAGQQLSQLFKKGIPDRTQNVQKYEGAVEDLLIYYSWGMHREESGKKESKRGKQDSFPLKWKGPLNVMLKHLDVILMTIRNY